MRRQTNISDVSTKSKDGTTPLHCAAAQCNLPFPSPTWNQRFQDILDNRSKEVASSTPEAAAVDAGISYNLLLKNAYDDFGITTEIVVKGQTIKKADNIHAEKIILLLEENGKDLLQAEDSAGRTPLHYAALNGNAVFMGEILGYAHTSRVNNVAKLERSVKGEGCMNYQKVIEELCWQWRGPDEMDFIFAKLSEKYFPEINKKKEHYEPWSWSSSYWYQQRVHKHIHKISNVLEILKKSEFRQIKEQWFRNLQQQLTSKRNIDDLINVNICVLIALSANCSLALFYVAPWNNWRK